MCPLVGVTLVIKWRGQCNHCNHYQYYLLPTGGKGAALRKLARYCSDPNGNNHLGRAKVLMYTNGNWHNNVTNRMGMHSLQLSLSNWSIDSIGTEQNVRICITIT